MKKRSEVFVMRISPQDRVILSDLARQLSRSQADALRVIARLAWQAMKDDDTKPNPPALEPVGM